jgi:hypothetical protein
MCQAKFIPVLLSQEGSLFRIEIDMLFVCRTVAEDASYTFVPVLSDPVHRVELPLVLVAGTNRYRVLKRMISSFWGTHYFREYKIQKILKAVNPSHVNYSYRIHINYEEWMSAAEIIFL